MCLLCSNKQINIVVPHYLTALQSFIYHYETISKNEWSSKATSKVRGVFIPMEA